MGLIPIHFYKFHWKAENSISKKAASIFEYYEKVRKLDVKTGDKVFVFANAVLGEDDVDIKNL